MRNQLNKDGYLIIKGFFAESEINSIYAEAKKLFAHQITRVLGKTVDINNKEEFEPAMFELFNADFETFKNVGLQTQHLISLHKLGTDTKILNLLQNLGLSDPSIAVRPSIQFNSRHLSKGGTHWKLGAHQDWRTGQGSLDSIVLWFPLIPANEALGALQVIPGSHHWGLLPAETSGYEGFIDKNLEDSQYKQCEFEAGDLLLFSAFLVHRSGNNITDHIRWSVQLRYNNLADPSFISRGMPMPYVYKPFAELVTPNFPEKTQISEVFAL
jgi:phytanoyl-CoA hydroxylase